MASTRFACDVLRLKELMHFGEMHDHGSVRMLVFTNILLCEGRSGVLKVDMIRQIECAHLSCVPTVFSDIK